MKNIKNFFSEQLRKLLFEKDFTQEDLAKKIGTNQQMISRWLTGVRNPSLNSIKKIAQALDVPMNYFIENSSNDKNTDKTEFDEKDIKILQLEKEILNLKNKILELEQENLKLKFEQKSLKFENKITCLENN